MSPRLCRRRVSASGAAIAAVHSTLRLAALAAALLCARPAAADGATVDQSYTLHARLDPERSEVAGKGRIRLRNHAQSALRELMFHLYPNAFAHSRTVFMREGGAAIRGGRLSHPGGIDVTELRLADGRDLLARADRALIKDDATQMRVPLPEPLPPGAALDLEMAFRVRLPSLFARMGASSDFFMVAQWFPKLARLSPGGWVSFPYHGLGEFYADFADYDLTVELPARFVVAAPGELTERRALAGGVRRERYVLRRALDVAWAAYPRLRRTSALAGAVRVDVFAPPGQAALAERQVALVRGGLRELGERFGPYPYPRLVVLLPPPEGRRAFGMEYPGLIVGAVAAWHTRVNPVADAVHELVTAHELAHQWFPMLAASNEVAAPVLDEGLAEWLGLHLIRESYGPRSPWLRLIGMPLDVFAWPGAMYRTARKVPSSLLPAYRYRGSELGPAVYLRPALTLEAIRRTWGERRLWSALGRYARAHRFGHPELGDLTRAFDAAYWPGFGAQVLLSALDGTRETLVRKPVPAPAPAARALPLRPSALLGRLLLWSQTLLGAFGP